MGQGYVPGGEVAAADVADLALADQLLHRLPDLLPRRGPVDVVHLVQVDVVGPQPSQARLARPPQVVGGQPAVVGAQAHRLVHLGGQDDVVAPPTALQPLTDRLLGAAVALGHVGGLRAAVDVGGVDVVDARVDGRVHEGEAGRSVCGVAEVHRAQPDPADQQTRATQVRVRHLLAHAGRLRPPYGEGRSVRAPRPGTPQRRAPMPSGFLRSQARVDWRGLYVLPPDRRLPPSLCACDASTTRISPARSSASAT